MSTTDTLKQSENAAKAPEIASTEKGAPSEPSKSPIRPENAPKRQKLDDNIDVSEAFSRREQTRLEKPSASVYSGEKSRPAWMKKEEDKYDKYGSRNLKNGAAETPDSRYLKYLSKSDSRGVEGRVKRHHEDEEERPSEQKKPLEDAAAPYSNIAIANAGSSSYQTFQSNILHRQDRDINSIVRLHYNQRTHQSKWQGLRTKSPIYKLRNFNNAIKYILLGNHCRRGPSGGPIVLLDLCCGKGGDLNKCEFVSVDQYVGIDISDASVKEAYSRYSQNKARFIPQGGVRQNRDSKRYNFDACFATGDCFSSSIPELLEPNFPGIIDNLFPVDCVLVQFSLHYSFETEEKVKQLLTNVTRLLRAGGTFVGTIPSLDFIRDKIVKKEYIREKTFGNDLYSFKFETEIPDDGVFRQPFGNKYTYYLKDAIDNVPEYVVPFEHFRLMCEDFGLTLKYKKNFIDIFNQEIPKYFSRLNKNLVEGMKRSDGKYGAEGMEKEAVGFYVGFVFEKLGG